MSCAPEQQVHSVHEWVRSAGTYRYATATKAKRNLFRLENFGPTNKIWAQPTNFGQNCSIFDENGFFETTSEKEISKMFDFFVCRKILAQLMKTAPDRQFAAPTHKVSKLSFSRSQIKLKKPPLTWEALVINYSHVFRERHFSLSNLAGSICSLLYPTSSLQAASRTAFRALN